MKRIIVITIIVSIICTLAYAKIYNTKELTKKNDNLKFSDIQVEAYDARGRRQEIREGNEKIPGYYYNFAINEILKGSEIGIIEGYDDGTFKPDNPVGKGDFIKLAISLALGVNNNANGVNRIDNYELRIPFEHYTSKYVAIAEMQGVIEHNQINSMNVDDPITRLEVITILSKIQILMKEIPQFKDGELPKYTDISSLTEEEKGYVLHAANYRLLENMESTTQEKELKPYANMTRAEIARALMRVY